MADTPVITDAEAIAVERELLAIIVRFESRLAAIEAAMGRLVETLDRYGPLLDVAAQRAGRTSFWRGGPKPGGATE